MSFLRTRTLKLAAPTGAVPSLRAAHSGHSPQAPQLQVTLALLKPTLVSYQPDVSAVLKRIKVAKFDIVRNKRIYWKEKDAQAFYKEHEGKFYYDRLIQGMTSGPSIALALAGPDVISRWRQLLGPTKAYKAKWEQPDCLRAIYGLGDTRNGFHGSDSQESALRELGLVFEGWSVEWWLEQRSRGLL